MGTIATLTIKTRDVSTVGAQSLNGPTHHSLFTIQYSQFSIHIHHSLHRCRLPEQIVTEVGPDIVRITDARNRFPVYKLQFVLHLPP
ncbi:MAG: hypothetical protein JWP27_1445 [Flaviaesturariibacter sp.]|nr:hypothetical protein [Flaviaesturariibacter sp.]